MARSTRPIGASRSQNKTPDTRPRRKNAPRRSVIGSGARKQSRSSRAQPPVLVRSETTSLPVDTRKRKKTRRRYDIALGMPGAELRLPSLPQVHFGWRVVSCLMVAMLAGALYAIWTAPEFQVQFVEFEGLVRLTPSDINAVLGLEDQRIFTIDPIQVRQDLLDAFPEISGISVEIGLPASVLVTLEERQPVLVLRHDEEEIWVDARGVGFPPRGEAGQLVVLEGELSSSPIENSQDAPARQVLAPEMIEAIISVTSHSPQGQPLFYDPQHGLGWSDERGWNVYFGVNPADVSEMEMKLRVYESLVERLQETGVAPRMISMEFLHAPYYRLE